MTDATTTPGRHEAPEPVRSLGDDLRDALSTRTVALVVAVLLLQLGFVLSYVGAFHAPSPRDVPVRVVGPAAATAPFARALGDAAGHPFAVTQSADRSAAERALRAGDVAAVLVVDPTGTADTLLVASGGGASVATAVETGLGQAEQQQGRTLQVVDAVPLQAGDARGLSGFYLVVGWLVGGYLMAAIVGVAKGARPLTPRRAAIRLGAVLPYAVLSGIGGAVVVGPVLGALDAPFLALAGLGALLVAAGAAVTMALQALFGVVGIGLTVLLFVVLGNPSAGGAYGTPLLPPFWRAVGPVLPNGAGVGAVRRLAYFDGTALATPVLTVAAWLVGGVAVTVAAVALRSRRQLNA